MSQTVSQLLARFPLVSSQLDKAQLAVILDELEAVIGAGIAGAAVEFGCYIGTTSLFIRRLLDFHDDRREFHVYDSFAGLPPKSAQDESRAGEQFQAGELAVSKKQFLREFQKAALRPPVIHKGWFRDLSSQDVPDRIAFAFLDGDFYASIHASFKLVLSRVAPGGRIVVDDYAREALPGVAVAVHEFGLHPRVSQNLGIIQL